MKVLIATLMARISELSVPLSTLPIMANQKPDVMQRPSDMRDKGIKREFQTCMRNSMVWKRTCRADKRMDGRVSPLLMSVAML
jgi:hypothetical protein